MARYRIHYYEEESGSIYFDAENITEAEEVLEQLQTGEIDYEDLNNVVKKVRNGQFEFESIEEVK